MVKDISAIELREKLSYSKDTGIFTWKVRAGMLRAGSKAGSNYDDYVRIFINNKRYYAHRLAFLYVNGKFPTHEVDHINGNKSDNRWDNLRDVTRSQNQHNRHIASRLSTTGLIGVRSVNGFFYASIKVNNVRKELGKFKTPKQAHDAYMKAKKIMHPNSFLANTNEVSQIHGWEQSDAK